MSLLTCDYRPAAALFALEVDRLRATLPQATDTAVRQTMEDAGAYMDETVPVDSGDLSRNRSPVRQDGPGTYSVTYDLPYAGILEYGGYPGTGPKTVQLGPADVGADFLAGAGIYSRQAPHGWVRKALVHVKPQLHTRVLAAVRTVWGGKSTAGSLQGNLPAIFGIDLI